MLFEKAIEIYLNWKATHTTVAYQRYLVRLTQFATFLGPDKKLEKVTSDDVTAFQRLLSSSNYYRGGNRKYSLSTVAYSSAILKNFFCFWVGRGISTVNPKEIISVRFYSPLKTPVSQEIFEILNKGREDNLTALAQKVFVNLLWDTGMRISELRDINCSDISEKHPIHQVRTAKIRTRKSMRYNIVVWSKKTDELLTRYLCKRIFINTDSDALFISTYNTKKPQRVTARTFQRWLKSMLRQANLPQSITPHSFRHGKAQSILNSSGNVHDISSILRHVKPESSFKYLNLDENRYIATAIKYLEH